MPPLRRMGKDSIPVIVKVANLVIVKNEIKDRIDGFGRQLAEIRCYLATGEHDEIMARIKLMEEKKAALEKVYEEMQKQLDEMLEPWMEV